MGKSPLLVHYHLYKNAGTSVDRNLSESFGGHWMAFEGPLRQFCLTNEDIVEFAEANPRVRAISSHHARPTPLLAEIHPILFLRHPLDRARSVYRFARRDPTRSSDRPRWRIPGLCELVAGHAGRRRGRA